MEITELQKDLAATFRWTARLNMHEAVANHFSACVPGCLLYTSPSPRDATLSRMPSSA